MGLHEAIDSELSPSPVPDAQAGPWKELVRHRREARLFIHRLPVTRSEGRIIFVPTSEIDWLEAANQYVRVHSGKNTYLVRGPMSQIVALLDPNRFCRVHRSATVSVQNVEQLQVEGRDHWLILKTGHRLRVSAARWETLKERLIWT